MTDELKPDSFYTKISKESVEFLDALLARFPEIKSAAIVIEWDLPENVQGELPAGFLRTPDKRISAPRAFDALRTATKYGKQLCSMIEYISAAEQKALTERAQTVANPTAWPAQVNEASQRKEEVSGNGNANVQAGSSVGS